MNLSYDLAKALKDAGYPVELVVDPDECPRDWYGMDGAIIMIPTLSELIATCGDDFGSLRQHSGQIGATNHSTPWWAATSAAMSVDAVGETGTTPEIAVARLWLALNRKV